MQVVCGDGSGGNKKGMTLGQQKADAAAMPISCSQNLGRQVKMLNAIAELKWHVRVVCY